jgi:hypothetical protein
MRRIITLSVASALLASIALSGAAAAATASYTTTGTFTCDGYYNSTYSVALWSKNPVKAGAKEVGKGLFFCEALNGSPYSGGFWTTTTEPATWARITWSGVSGQCADGPRSYQLPTPVVRNATSCTLPNYVVSVQVQRSVRG